MFLVNQTRININIHTAMVISLLVCATPLAAAPQTKETPKSNGTKTTGEKNSLYADIEKRVKSKTVKENDLQRLAKAIKANAKDWKSHRLLGDCYRSLGMLEMADTEYLEALKFHPDRDEEYVAAIETVYSEHGLVAAEERLRFLQETLADSPVTVVLRVILMLEGDNEWGATHVCDVWERTHTNHFSLPTSRAFILYHNKKYKEALAEVEKDLKVKPNFKTGLKLKQTILDAAGKH